MGGFPDGKGDGKTADGPGAGGCCADKKAIQGMRDGTQKKCLFGSPMFWGNQTGISLPLRFSAFAVYTQYAADAAGRQRDNKRHDAGKLQRKPAAR